MICKAKAIVRGLLAVAVVVSTTSLVQGQTHATWPTDWNDWSDPALYVTVGDAGNTGESSGGYYSRVCGAVDYDYNIGKYEVTAGQYTAFLNAVAATDTYQLYDTYMWSHAEGCKIQRSGTSGSYTYTVASDYANRPVNRVDWGDAARFTNWLNNGQPTGAQDLTTTEDGAYFLDGATSASALLAVSRESDWEWAITSEDEWYKAAYYKGGTSNDYWDYPTCSDDQPGRDMTDASGNNANYQAAGDTVPITPPYYTTEAGEFQSSDSPYGTFDQGGNIWEWTDTVIDSSPWSPAYSLRGGRYNEDEHCMLASYRSSSYGNPTYENFMVGFRVSQVVPEPGTLALLATGLIGLLCYAWRKRS